MQRAVNPQTGEVLFLVNNQWVPPSQTATNPETGQSAYLVNNEWQIVDPLKKPEEPGFLERVTGITPGQLAEAASPDLRRVADIGIGITQGIYTGRSRHNRLIWRRQSGIASPQYITRST